MNPTCKTASLIAMLCALPAPALADAYTSLTYGSGPDGYRSYAFSGNADITDSVRFKLDSFLAKANQIEDTRQSGIGLSWNATDLASFNYRLSSTSDGYSQVSGNEGGVSFALDTLWESDLRTDLNLDYGQSKFDFAKSFPRLPNPKFTQSRSSLGLSQDLTTSFSLYGSHDRYRYDRDIQQFAIGFAVTHPRLAQKSLTLLAFPEKTNTLGMRWDTSDKLTVDLSADRSTTVVHRSLNNTRLGLDYQASKKLNLGIAFIRSVATAVVNNRGRTVQQETRDTYSEVTAGWAF